MVKVTQLGFIGFLIGMMSTVSASPVRAGLFDGHGPALERAGTRLDAAFSVQGLMVQIDPESGGVLQPDPSERLQEERRPEVHPLCRDWVLVLKSYPDSGIGGIGLGVSAKKDEADTFYLGPGFRLVSSRTRMVASFSLGAAIRPIKRLPGMSEAVSDRRPESRNQLDLAPYASVQLDFTFGRRHPRWI